MGRESSKLDSSWFPRAIEAGDVITPLPGRAGTGGAHIPAGSRTSPRVLFPLSHAPGSPPRPLWKGKELGGVEGSHPHV